MKVTDMTSGSPVRLILTFAVPLFIGNVFQQIYSMVDTMIAGYNLGDDAIAAIGATSALYGLLINLASGLNSGYAIVITQRFGAHDEKKLRGSIAGTVVLDAGITVALTALSLIFLKPLMRFMNTPDAIFTEAYKYIAVICAGMAATVCYNMFAGILRAVGNSRAPLYFLMISSALNIALDLLFVAVLKTGVSGAAFATVIAQAVSAALCGVYVFKKYRAILPSRDDFRECRKTFSELLPQGIAMGLMLCVVDLGSVIFQRANNDLGESIISAHTAARRIIVIMMQPLGTISTASSTFVGQNFGARKLSRIKFALKRVMLMEIAWSAFSCALIFLFGGALVRFTTGTEDIEIVENAVTSLRWHLSFFPVLGCLLALRTAMQAMGRKLAPIISSCLELGMKILSAAILIPRLGFLGTCVTEPFTWVIMFAFLGGAYLAIRKRVFPDNENDILKGAVNYDGT
ncbi:MAG: MATE family efflux transporter [Lachnospiraceae bacterium]|nr:MATE family efflux transporter [Ruminococcus sp.]MCM1276358.1 MATE family efflux transporter [Lachnospiraceae bacterium]